MRKSYWTQHWKNVNDAVCLPICKDIIIISGMPRKLMSPFCNYRYFCRSMTFDNISNYCVLSSEDSVSVIEQDLSILTGSGYYYYEVVCISNGNAANYTWTQIHREIQWLDSIAENEVTLQRDETDASPLLVDGRRRDILTAFQRYRNSRLSADFQTEITDRSLAECLDECLRQVLIQEQKELRSNSVTSFFCRRVTDVVRRCTASATESAGWAAQTKRMAGWSTIRITTTMKVYQVFE